MTKRGEPLPHRVHVMPWLRRPGSLMLRDWLAITVGRHILAWRDLDARELRHELEHVRQWRRNGPLFGITYLLASYRAWRGGGRWYRDNPYERAAREAEDDSG